MARTRIPDRLNGAQATRNPHLHPRRGRSEMVPLEGESLNSLFQTLADWNEQLKHHQIDFEEPHP